MRCSKCGAQNSEGVKFCGSCGSNLNELGINIENINIDSSSQQNVEVTNVSQENNSTNQQSSNINNKKNNNIWIFIVLAVIVVSIIIGILALALFVCIGNLNYKNRIDDSNNKIPEINEYTDSSVDSVTGEDNSSEGAFLMPIEDVFTITGRGTAVTGRVDRGAITVGDSVQIVGLDNEVITTTVEKIEMFRNEKTTVEAGDNAAIILKNVTKDQVKRGQVLAQPDSIVSAKKFDAEVYFLTKQEGGRHTPFDRSYAPVFYFRTIDISGILTLPTGVDTVSPGNTTKLTVELETSVAMEEGTKFRVREDGRTVGEGKITKVYS